MGDCKHCLFFPGVKFCLIRCVFLPDYLGQRNVLWSYNHFRLLSSSTTQRSHFPAASRYTLKLVVIKYSSTLFCYFLHFFLVVDSSSSYISYCLVVPSVNYASSSRIVLSFTQFIRDIKLLCWNLVNIIFPYYLSRLA